MKQLDKIKEWVKSLSGKTIKIMVAVLAAVIIFSVVAAMLLNHTNYAVLFSGLNENEATEVIAKLNESGTDYQYHQDGKIMVPSDVVDKTRATLAVEGYPKNGFTYDTFINNAGMMATEADKQTYKLYELQNRIGATIRNFDGVKSAVVTISPAETQKYVLDNSTEIPASAYAVVDMYDGGSPTTEQVKGIQRLIAKAVPNMELGDVAVIDGNGVDVSVEKNDGSTTAQETAKKTEYEKTFETGIESKVLGLLEPIYGRNNVRVAAKCTADMQKILSEEIQYTAPNKEDNSGYISHQSTTNESSGGGTTGGTPGTQSNTNVSQYNTNNNNANGSSASSSDTDYELNQKKIQGQDDSGAIKDLSIAVTINSSSENNTQLSQNEIVDLIAKAAGMDEKQQTNKISVAKADFYDNTQNVPGTITTPTVSTLRKYMPFIIAGLIGLLFILIILPIIIHKVRKSRAVQEVAAGVNVPQETVRVVPVAQGAAGANPAQQESMLNLDNQHGIELKEDVNSFADQNPEISAALLKNWLRGGDDYE